MHQSSSFQRCNSVERGIILKQSQDLYKKIEFSIYSLCIFLTSVICILIYADGIIRDEYNTCIDGLRLRQNLFILIFYNVIFMVSKCHFRNSIVKKGVMGIFIPIFLISSITVGNNVLLAGNIIQKNRFHETGFNEIHLKDLKDILAKGKNATVYIERGDCPACKEIFPKLELYLYKNHLSILSYNTLEDRDDNLEELMEILDKLGVDRVPVILKIERGIVSEAYFVEDIEKIYGSTGNSLIIYLQEKKHS